MADPQAIAERLAAVRARIAAAAERSGRSADAVSLVGVTKRVPAEAVTCAVRAGLREIGENYVQEAVAKRQQVLEALADEGVDAPRWHFIGQLQRNKAGVVARMFDAVETLDRERLGQELDRRAAGRATPLEALIQVNLSNEMQKGGVHPDGIAALLAASAAWNHLRVVGLMAIPAPGDDPEASRPAFARLRSLRDALRGELGGADLRELSMGMSADFEIAIEEGATRVRVGTAVFGPREKEERR